MRKNNRVPYIKPYKSIFMPLVNPIEIKKPPIMPQRTKFDFISVIITLVMNALVCFIIFAMQGTFSYYFLLFPITMFMIPFVTHWRSKGNAKKTYGKAVKQYEEYLGCVEEKWKKQNNLILQYYSNNFLMPSQLIEAIIDSIENNGDTLWSVLPEHQEFLVFRAGVYEMPSPVAFLHNNEWDGKMPEVIKLHVDSIVSRNSMIPSMPLAIDLKKNCFIAVQISNKKRGMRHFSAFMFSLLATHAYDDVKLAVLAKESSDCLIGWLRWFPHIWNEQGDFRYYCADDSNKSDILDHLENVISNRLQKAGKTKFAPEYILVVEDVAAFFSHPVSRYFSSTDAKFGFRIIFILNEKNTVPSICSLIIDVAKGRIYKNNEKDPIPFVCDEIDLETAEGISRMLSNVELVNGERSTKIPKIVTFFDLLASNALRHETIKKVWGEKRSHLKNIGLLVPIGVTIDGLPICVDFKDGADGPHAIIAGMTGSGKTELLQTLILSLCVNYSPEQVAFAFIDFKEGGMAKQFRGIPHESGILTNKGNHVAYLANRAITMLQQEKKYRGSLLSEYGLDIDRYHKKYYGAKQEKMVPLPHLFVIIDESAEVVDQFREFMGEMVSLARVGRSMGIHLILSTQNPSRTVDSQILDNANLKICLSVLNEEESKAILKVKDAAYIVPRGRAILMAGNGRRYEEFQSAYAGAIATSSSEHLGTEPIVVFPDGNTAQLGKDMENISASTQLEETLAVLRRLVAYCPDHKVFSDTLPDALFSYDVDENTLNGIGSKGLKAVIGKADVLEKQVITDVVVDFDVCRNLVIYGSPRSGKTTLLETILLDLVQRYPQDEVQCIVVANCASAMIRFAKCSFVAEILTEADTEKLYRLPQFLIEESKRRFVLMKNAGAMSIEDYKPSSHRFPRIVVFFDSLQYYPFIGQLAGVFAAGSAQAGIHVIGTYQDSSLPRSIVSFFGGQVALQIHDDLSFKYGISYNRIVENHAGRGIYGDQDMDYLEVQVFQPSLTVSNARKAGAVSQKIIKQPYSINNGSIDYLDGIIKPADPLQRVKITTVADVIHRLYPTTASLPIGIFYETLQPFAISDKTKACLFSILGDKQVRDDLTVFFDDKLREIGNLVFFGDGKPIPDAAALSAMFAELTRDNRHLFLLIYYEKQEFLTAGTSNENQNALVHMLETVYRGKTSLIVVTSARLAKNYAPVNEYCINANGIVAIGGKHDAHVRFADVSTRIVGIPKGEAYVSTSATKFERLVLKKYVS